MFRMNKQFLNMGEFQSKPENKNDMKITQGDIMYLYRLRISNFTTRDERAVSTKLFQFLVDAIGLHNLIDFRSGSAHSRSILAFTLIVKKDLKFVTWKPLDQTALARLSSVDLISEFLTSDRFDDKITPPTPSLSCQLVEVHRVEELQMELSVCRQQDIVGPLVGRWRGPYCPFDKTLTDDYSSWLNKNARAQADLDVMAGSSKWYFAAIAKKNRTKGERLRVWDLGFSHLYSKT